MTDTTLLRELPDGRSLVFEERDTGYRAYKLVEADGKATRMPSVTTILDVLDKRALKNWFEDHGARGTLAAVRMGELDPLIHTDEEAIGIVRALGLGADAARNKAARRGLSIHDALEVYCRTAELPGPESLDENHRPYLQGLARALLDLDPHPTVVEQITCHPELKYAGRLDLRAIVAGKDTIIDLATNSSGRGYAEKHIQVRGYEAAEVALGAEPAERLLIVGIGPDGTYNADHCTAPYGAFEQVLAVHRLMADVRRPLEAARRADKKMREAAAA
jgi:hypothetical protein